MMMLGKLFFFEGTNRLRDRQQLGNFYREAMYDILKEENLQASTYTKLRQQRQK
jgi:hypothetical protein